MFNFPPELLQHTAKFVTDDPSVDDETLKACSLTFKGLTHLFQHAFTSRKAYPEIKISADYPRSLYNGRFHALLDILKTNPSFAASIARVKVTITKSEEGDIETVLPDDSEVYTLLSLLTRLSSLSIGSVSEDWDVEYDSGPPSVKDVLFWTRIPEKLRRALECVVRSPLLQHLELTLVAVPWRTFFGSRTSLDRLSLRKVLVEEVPTPADGVDQNPPTSASRVAVRHLDACQWSAVVLVYAMVFQDNSPIHIEKVQTLEVHVPRVDEDGARFEDAGGLLLRPELRIEELIVRTHEIWHRSGTELFEPDQSCLANLKRLELRFAVDPSGGSEGSDPLKPWADALGQFPADNKLEALTFNIWMWEGVYPTIAQWMGLVGSLGQERFPHLKKVHLNAGYPGEDAPWMEDRKIERENLRNCTPEPGASNVQSASDAAETIRLEELVANIRQEIGTIYAEDFDNFALKVVEDRSWESVITTK